MLKRKAIEVGHYDAKYGKTDLKVVTPYSETDIAELPETAPASLRLCYQILKEKCTQGQALDYGCGLGQNTMFMALCGADCLGIDLSEKGIEIANKVAAELGLKGKCRFLVADCEKTGFPDSHFDILFDAGTFSSLEKGIAFREVARILKPDGMALCIETLAHNPFGRAKRQLNKLFKFRTAWAVRNIITVNDLVALRACFSDIQCYYFHLLSAFTLLYSGRKLIMPLHTFLEFLDGLLLRFIPFLSRYAFKIVMILKRPRAGIHCSDYPEPGDYLLFKAKGGATTAGNNELPDGFRLHAFNPTLQAPLPAGWFRTNASFYSCLIGIIGFYIHNLGCWAVGRDPTRLHMVYREGELEKLVHYCFVKSSNSKRISAMNPADFEFGPYWTDDQYRGKSITPAVVKKLVADTKDGQIYVLIRKNNLSSIRVMQKTGFEFVCSHHRRRRLGRFSFYEPILEHEDNDSF